MKHAPLVLLVLLLSATLLGLGCDNVEPSIVGTPTPSASPTPLPEPFTAEITALPQATDILGNAMGGDDHYAQYLSFGDLRVYEYGEGTFLDGICVNAYPQPLNGRLDIVYYTESDKICGQGTIHNADGTGILATGTNAIYAEIDTDIDVQSQDFVLEIKTPFQPAEAPAQ